MSAADPMHNVNDNDINYNEEDVAEEISVPVEDDNHNLREISIVSYKLNYFIFTLLNNELKYIKC